MNDNGTSRGNDRAIGQHPFGALFDRRSRYGLGGLLWALACLSLIGLAQGQIDRTDLLRNATMLVKRQVVVKRNTWPTATTIYIFEGTGWVSVNVGPAQSDLIVTKSNSMTSDSSYIVGRFVSNVTVPAITGAYTEGTLPQSTLNMAYAPTYEATSSGPITQLPAICDECDYVYRYGSPTAGTTTFIQNPPIYIQWLGGTEGGGVGIDNGSQADFDGDGVPDTEDPDDDNDGRPDGTDAFPKNPGEKDDTDGDGTGNNADHDDDGDGYNDEDDSAPLDPGVHELDDDGDGVPNHNDAFPNNPRESGDSDGDGVGNNQDPDDNTPPGGGNQGDGDGDPGTGDGDGGPGPVPKPGDGGTDTGTAGTGDTSGQVLPGAAHDVAGAGNGIGAMIPSKVGQFNPVGAGAVPKATTYVTSLSFGRWGSHLMQIDFSNGPWPMLRALMFAILTYHVACGVIRQLKI